MHRIPRMREGRPPAWRIAAAILAVFFVTMGLSKVIGPRGGRPADLGWLTTGIGAAELTGGLMLLVPGLVAHAAFFLVPVVGLIALVGGLTIGPGVVLPGAMLLVALVMLGVARRPRALLQARLERAMERVVRLEMARSEEVRREGF